MSKSEIIIPHGGTELVNRIVPEAERAAFVEKALGYKQYTISNADLSVFYRIADGTLSPLTGPMNKDEFYRVLDHENIERDGKAYAWTIPIAFSAKEEENFKIGDLVAIKNEFGLIVGSLEVSDVYRFDKQYYNKAVYGTDRLDHPGPRIVNDDPKDYLLGGIIWALPELNRTPYTKYMLAPKQIRILFKEKNWQKIVAFQTRNPLHRAHEYAMIFGMEKLVKEGSFCGVVLNPLVGATKSDDVPADIRMKTYEALIKNKIIGQGDKDTEFWSTKDYDFNDQCLLIGLDMKMFYAGPKEAIMHAIYRQNCGFTDIIIGRKHADAHFDDGDPLWGDFDAQEKFSNLKGDLKISPVKVGFAAYFEELGKVGLIEEFKNQGYHQVSISGKDLRKKLVDGEDIDERIMRKCVSQILAKFYRAQKEGTTPKSKNITWHETGISKQDRELRNKHKGAVIWLTGLPASGKSTIAVELQAFLFEMGYATYVLDGDNIRHGLNSDLGFSPEDREENIRRIGEVAKLFSDAGVLVITAFISPYLKDRERVRAILAEGDFVEIFVEASLAECERRDPKGLYKKARRGEIKEFTGISAPYESPQQPEIHINTEKMTKQECAQIIIRWLGERDYLISD
ncbi:MAG: adenylyl-sulfate kinase [Candidatus Omnitrophota bacterium]